MSRCIICSHKLCSYCRNLIELRRTRAAVLQYKRKLSEQNLRIDQLRKQAHENVAKVVVKNVGTNTTAEVRKNVVKTAERLTVNNIRTYYIKKMQEMEAKQLSQVAAIKRHLSSARQNDDDPRREKDAKLGKVGTTEKAPILDARKKGATANQTSMKNTCQQTDPSLEANTLVAIHTSDQVNYVERCQELQNRIAKMIADDLLKEKLVKSLKEQVSSHVRYAPILFLMYTERAVN